MSTALLLLLAVAAAAVLAVIVPQETTSAATVAHWRAGVAGPGPMTTALLDAAGLFDVIGSWWFRALAGLLLMSLVSCLVPRHRALLRSWRRPPPAGRELDEVSHRAVLTTPLDAETSLALARAALRRQRHRVRLRAAGDAPEGRAQLAAERGVRAREAGSVAFHDAVLLLLVGVAIGQVLGFTGQVDLVQGTRFVDTRVAYDRVAAGAGFGLDDHAGFSVDLLSFRTSDHPDGTPREFVAAVAVDDGPPLEVEINHPLVHDGFRVHLARHGLAPTLRVTDSRNGTDVFRGPVLLAPAGPLAWAGLATMRDGDDQRVVDVVLLPDAEIRADGQPTAIGAGGGRPVLVADVYPGAALTDDGVRRTVDRSVGALGATAVVPAGVGAPLGDRTWEVSFEGPVPWVGLQVSRVPGLRVLLVAALVLLVGLVVSLHATPQRLWVEARPAATGTELVVAGVARHRTWAFERSFPAAVAAVERRLAAAVQRAPAEQPADLGSN